MFGRIRWRALLVPLILLAAGCATSLPAERHSPHAFPQADVYVEQPLGPHLNQPVKPLGWVRTRVRFPTLEQDVNNAALCRNYYNKAAGQLLKEARKVGADAVIQVRSVVLLFSGQMQEFPTPECSDDGAEGEILLKGIAVKYLPFPVPTPKPSPTHH
jgi:hypothetical protein